MPVLTLEESHYAGLIPDGSIFEAQCVAVKQITARFIDKETGKAVEQMEFKFLVQEGDWEGTPVWGKTSLSFVDHPDCRLRNWSQEILATELPVGYQLDTDDLEGNFCRVVMGVREYEKNGEAKQVNFVQDVLRSRSATETTDF